jgi:uncharacterized protein YceK
MKKLILILTLSFLAGCSTVKVIQPTPTADVQIIKVEVFTF